MSAGLAGLDPADLLRLFSGVPMGAPQAFAGTSGTVVPDQPAPTPAPAPVTAPLPPQRPAGLASAALGDLQADMPAPGAVPMQAPKLDMTPPVAPAAPGLAAPGLTAAAEPPGFGTRLGTALTKMGESGFGDQLLALSAGLLSGPGMGGFAKGLAGMSAAGAQSAATDLARSKFQLEQQRAARESAALSGNAAILKRAYPNLSDAEAQAQGSNSAAVTEALKIMRDPNHGRENDPANIRSRAQAQAEGAAAGGKDDIQLVTRPDGSIVAVNKSQIGEPAAATSSPALTPLAPGVNKTAAEADERRQTVVAQGHDPKDPRYADFIVSGSLPKESQQNLSAGDKKVINEAEDQSLLLGQTIDTLKRAKDLNNQTFTGATAGIRGKIGSTLPDWMVPDFVADPKTSAATREFGQIMSMEAIKSMSQTLKGATTDREMDRFIEILGDPATPPDIRARTLDRMHTLAIRQQQLAQSRMTDMRGGTYYKPQQGPQPAGGSPTTGARLRFDPSTGGFN